MVEQVQDVQAAREALLNGTLNAADFDAQHGQGAAATLIREALGITVAPAAAAEPTAPPTQEEAGFLDSVMETVSEIPSAIARGVFGAGAEAVETTANAGQVSTQSFGQTVDGMIALRERALGRSLSDEEKQALATSAGVTLAGQGMRVGDDRVDYDTQDVVNALGLEEALQPPTTVGGALTEGISQFVTGFAALGGGASFAGAMLKGAVVDATMFDPYEANLSSFLQENKWADNAVTEALSTDPNAPEWENRLRNSLEGALGGAAVEAVVRGIKFVAVGRKAREEIEELGQVTDETAAELDQVHEDAANAEQALDETTDKLVARDDGTFEAPDGTTYKPEGETLVEQPKPNADPVDAPRDAPEAPTAPTRDEMLRDDLAAQTAPEVVAVKPKVDLVDKERFAAAIQRSVEMGDFELRNIDEAGWFNLGRMEGPVEAAKVIDTFQDILTEGNTARKMGLDKPQTHQTVIRQSLKYIAGNTGTNVNKLIRDLNVSETMSRDMAARIVAGKMALQSTGREITNLASKIDIATQTGKADETLERQLLDLMQMHVELQANVKGLQTAAARATSAGRIMTKDSLSADTLDSLSAFGGSKKVREMARQLAKITDDAKRAHTVRKVVERKWMRVLNEYWINQILSGYTTHALNLTSNAINAGIRPAERAVGAIFSGDSAEALKAFKQYQYLAYYFGDAVRLAAKSGWNHRPILDDAIKFDTAQGTTQRAISSEFLGVTNKKAATALDLIGKVLTMPSRILGSEDEFFKQLSFRANLKANLTVDAARLSDADLAKLGYSSREDFVSQEFEKAFTRKIDAEERWQEAVITGKVVDDPKVKQEFIERSIGSSSEASKYAQQALREARDTTFTTPLQRGTFSHDVQTLANRNPLMRQIIPFIQTPMNIMAQAWDRTPGLNLMRRQYVEDLRSADPAVVAQAKGKMAVGIAIYGSLTALAMDGRITGGGPTDPKLAALYRNSKDWQPYSINVGTVDNPKWISYQRMDPWTTAFGIVGDISEMIQMGQMADNDAADIISMTIAAFGNNIVSKTYLQGISDVVELMNSKDRPWEFEATMRQRAASMMPYSSMTNQLGGAFDDNLREVRTYMDKFRQQSGVLRSQLPMKYDWISGQPMETPERMLGYINVKKMKPEERDIALINSEMRKLGFRFTGADRKIAGVTLTPEQYQRWNQLIGDFKIGGKKLSERLVATINSDRYRKDDDDYGLVMARESHRVEMLNTWVSRYRQRARRELMKEYPELRQAVREYDRYVDKSQRGQPGERPIIDMNELQ